jgi:hypothetical protein
MVSLVERPSVFRFLSFKSLLSLMKKVLRGETGENEQGAHFPGLFHRTPTSVRRAFKARRQYQGLTGSSMKRSFCAWQGGFVRDLSAPLAHRLSVPCAQPESPSGMGACGALLYEIGARGNFRSPSPCPEAFPCTAFPQPVHTVCAWSGADR